MRLSPSFVRNLFSQILVFFSLYPAHCIFNGKARRVSRSAQMIFQYLNSQRSTTIQNISLAQLDFRLAIDSAHRLIVFSRIIMFVQRGSLDIIYADLPGK